MVRLQQGDIEVRKGWSLICDVSRQGIQNKYLFYANDFSILEFNIIYERLGITLTERGESFYQPFMPGIVGDLESKGKKINPNIKLTFSLLIMLTRTC